MPRNSPITTTKAKWSKKDLGNVLQATCDEDYKKFSIPFSTLQERIKKNHPTTGPFLGKHPTFSSEEKKGMAENIKFLHLENSGTIRRGYRVSYKLEKGKNVTVICAVSATGSYISMFIYTRKKMSPRLCITSRA
ncbi:hypothetical protein ILUMI_01944 [Ignelater luminosus]|uniref:Uncharacterized protein n=1 Tax=Ignelater luminosus TaxID=2038154 RepID=A0A8K0DIM7_IGNLU|nr:hypothetical protein ILUMI_01944 [Ignelater luminosus]